MGKRHNTLNDTIFKNSKYMEVVNSQIGCKDLKKDYKEQYDFMYDTFSTLILLNNAFFSDSNLSMVDKVSNALDIMEQYLFTNYNESDKRKYSVRTIQSICEKYSTHIYRRINEWHESLENLTPKYITTTNIVANIKRDIEEEMTRLENVGFDNMVKEKIDYKKNKDSDYKIYISKFDSLYTSQEAFLEAYKHDFSELYGIDLTDEDLSTMAMLYTLLAKANNGIVNILSSEAIKDYGLNERSTPNDFYNAYLDTLHIKPKDRDRLEAQQFMLFFLLDYKEYCMPKLLTMNDMINNYDNFYFLFRMKELLKDDTFKPTNDMANGLYKNLKSIYDLVNRKVSNTDEIMENYARAYEEITKVINRHLDYFIRLS